MISRITLFLLLLILNTSAVEQTKNLFIKPQAVKSKYGLTIRNTIKTHWRIAENMTRIKKIASLKGRNPQENAMLKLAVKILIKHAYCRKFDIKVSTTEKYMKFFETINLPLDSDDVLEAARCVGRLHNESDPENSPVFIKPLGEKLGYNYVEREQLIN